LMMMAGEPKAGPGENFGWKGDPLVEL
jgi:hypothetical protein